MAGSVVVDVVGVTPLIVVEVELGAGVEVGVGDEIEPPLLALLLLLPLLLTLLLTLLLSLPLLALLVMLLVALDAVVVSAVVLWVELLSKELEEVLVKGPEEEVVVTSDVGNVGVPITPVDVPAETPAPVDPPAGVVTSAAAPVGTMGVGLCALQ